MNHYLKILALGALLVLPWIDSASAQQVNNYWCSVSTVPCPPSAWLPTSAGNPFPITGSFSAASFHMTSALTPLSVTNTSQTSPVFTTGNNVVVTNVGTTNTMYCQPGATATVNSQPIAPNDGWFEFATTSETTIACITASSTTTANFAVGTGGAAGTGGGGGGGSSGGAVFGPTAVGSANANPPVVIGGTATGAAGQNVEGVTVKPASTAPAATDLSLVTAESPNSQLSTTVGTTADTAYTGTGNATLDAALKGIYTVATAPMPCKAAATWNASTGLTGTNPVGCDGSAALWSDLGAVGGSAFVLGQQLAASSLPVVLTTAQISTLTPLSTVAVTQGTSPWVISGSLTANQSVNVAQFGGVSTSTGQVAVSVAPVTATNTALVVDLRPDSPGIITLGPASIANAVPQTLSSQYPTNNVTTTPAAVTATATGTTASTAASLAATASVTNYVCGFDITADATTLTTGTAVLSGTISGSLSYLETITAVTNGTSQLTRTFNPCIPASAANTAITITAPAAGTGGNTIVNIWGYRL